MLKKNISWIKSDLFFKKGKTEKTMEMKFSEKMLLVLLEKLKTKIAKGIQHSRFKSFCLKHGMNEHVIPFNFPEIR